MTAVIRPARIACAVVLSAVLLAHGPVALAVNFMGKPLPPSATTPPRGAVALTETSAIGAWQEDLEPGMREPNGRPSFPGMTWVIRADHTISIFTSCRDMKPGPHIDGTWTLDEQHFLKIEAVRKDGAHLALGSMPAWTVGGRFAIAPNHPGAEPALNRYDGPVPPRCAG